jgi:6-pyruvoyl-tetrahydropterin synthase
MQEMRLDLELLIQQLDGAYLNDVFRYPPTAETIACWLMARLPSYWDHVKVECYDGYTVEVQANALRAAWADNYREGSA